MQLSRVQFGKESSKEAEEDTKETFLLFLRAFPHDKFYTISFKRIFKKKRNNIFFQRIKIFFDRNNLKYKFT